MNKSNFFSNIKSKMNVKSKSNVKSNIHNNSNNLKGGAAQPAQAGQARGGCEPLREGARRSGGAARGAAQ